MYYSTTMTIYRTVYSSSRSLCAWVLTKQFRAPAQGTNRPKEKRTLRLLLVLGALPPIQRL